MKLVGLALALSCFSAFCSVGGAGAAPPALGTVRGMDGQADLRLDYGRGLRSFPLTKAAARARFGATKPHRRSASWLIYDARDRYKADHAYVEARAGGRRLLLDPFNPTPVQPIQRTRVNLEAEGVQGPRVVHGLVTDRGWLYLPTNDLQIYR